MNKIFKGLKGHKVVEMNNVYGYRTGHMLSQVPMIQADQTGLATEESIDQGYIFELNEKNEIVLSEAGKGVLYLHFSEEHMTFYDNASLDMFTVDYRNGVAYPRGIALHAGDVFTTDNFKGSLPAKGEYKEVTVVKGELTVGGDATADSVMIATKAKLPAGQDAIEVTYRG